jgi:hypothetical protein
MKQQKKGLEMWMWFPMVDNEQKGKQMASNHSVLRCVKVYNGSLRGLF